MAEIIKYKYIGKEHTMVKISEKSPKVRVESWEIFESEIKYWNTYFQEINKSVTAKFEDTRTTDIPSERWQLIKQYIEKFGKRPWPKWTDEEILSKLA